jgi:hypothetical protein
MQGKTIKTITVNQDLSSERISISNQDFAEGVYSVKYNDLAKKVIINRSSK